MPLNRQRFHDSIREYLQEKIKEAIVPNLSTQGFNIQYGTTTKNSIVEKIINFARNDIHNLDDSVLQHFSVNDEAFDEWHKEHFNGWIKKTNNGINAIDQTVHSLTADEEQKDDVKLNDDKPQNDDDDIIANAGDVHFQNDDYNITTVIGDD